MKKNCPNCGKPLNPLPNMKGKIKCRHCGIVADLSQNVEKALKKPKAAKAPATPETPQNVEEPRNPEPGKTNEKIVDYEV
jgi:uncharacterized Zn finger protein (UPF0148 family)